MAADLQKIKTTRRLRVLFKSALTRRINKKTQYEQTPPPDCACRRFGVPPAPHIPPARAGAGARGHRGARRYTQMHKAERPCTETDRSAVRAADLPRASGQRERHGRQPG